MPEVRNITFSHEELAQILVREHDLHEGLWAIYLEFGLAAANINLVSEDNLTPAAIVPVVKIGIQRFDEPNSLTVDAAEVNPASKQRTTPAKRGAGVEKGAGK